MPISAHSLAIDTFVPMLRSLSVVLDKGAQHASARGFDVALLVTARLAPDMYTLRQQVQLACFAAEDARVRLIGQDPALPPTADETFEALKTRIDRTIDTLQKTPETSSVLGATRGTCVALKDRLNSHVADEVDEAAVVGGRSGGRG